MKILISTKIHLNTVSMSYLYYTTFFKKKQILCYVTFTQLLTNTLYDDILSVSFLW